MISIVVPVYNAEKYLQKCIQSILAQTYSDWELVLIDNGSTDESMRICKEYAGMEERISAIHQYRNQGVSAARNLGMEQCRGEFITFIDADDWVKEDYLETLVKLQKSSKAPIVICGYEAVYDEDRNKKNNFTGSKDSRTVKVYNVKEYLQEYLLEGNTHCWGILFESCLLEQLKFPTNLTIGEDLLFVLEACLQVEKIVVSAYKGYYYYINTKGAMLKKFSPRYMDQITCWESALSKIKEAYPNVIGKTESILVVSVLLVVGKISELDLVEQELYKQEKEECYRTFMKYGKKREILKYLPKGYSFKAFFYRYFPDAYIKFYGKLRQRKIKR